MSSAVAKFPQLHCVIWPFPDRCNSIGKKQNSGLVLLFASCFHCGSSIVSWKVDNNNFLFFYILFLIVGWLLSVLHWFLPYINMNQSQGIVALGPASHLPPHPTPLGCHRALGWVPCIKQQIPTGYLFYIRQCVCFSATLSVHPTFSFPHCVRKSVLYICVSIAALQISSSVLFF